MIGYRIGSHLLKSLESSCRCPGCESRSIDIALVSSLCALRQALDLWPSAIKSYKRAINTLPKESMTPAELTQKKQYEAALDAVTIKQQNLEAARNRPRQQPTADEPYISMNTNTQRMPWVVANELIPNLRLKENYFSSVSFFTPLLDCPRNSCA